MDQYIGKLLDNRYELLEVIGTGGMAVVYKARCHRLNRLVAVKVLKSDLAQDAEFRRRFHDESQAVAMLSHPNIVSVYDVSRSSELDYIVMELIDGITLKQYMQKKGAKLNWREALHFITQIMRGLSHAHSRGIIHRDIKPHNIMVLRDGSVKVADFGIARLVSAAQSTLTQEALGSVHYISPEQARGSHIDARADIYSAGVVLYEMTTGRLPFEGESAVSVAIQHINSIPLSPRELDPELPEALESIILKAMAPAADARYESADVMLADLEEFRKNPNINFEYNLAELTAEPATDEPTRKVRRAEGSAAAAAVARDERAAKRQERRERREQPEVEERESVWPLLLAIGAILVFIVGIGYFLWSTFFSDMFRSAETFVVPNLSGLTIEQAQELPEVAGVFTIELGAVVEDSLREEGLIVYQTPAAKTTVRAGSLVITVDISAGRSERQMPAVVNLEQRAALDILENLYGLTVTIEPVTSESVTSGRVVSSVPAEGEVLQPDQQVTILVSTGPAVKKATVISFVGMSLERVKDQLVQFGLTLGTVNEVPNNAYIAGVVVWQSIEPTTEVTPGTVIDFNISNGEREPDAPIETGTGNGEGGEGGETGDPTQTDPEPTPSDTGPTTPAILSKSVKVNLPDRDGKVVVVIYVGDDEQWRNTVDCRVAPTISPLVSGSGVQVIRVYLDDELVDQFELDFNA